MDRPNPGAPPAPVREESSGVLERRSMPRTAAGGEPACHRDKVPVEGIGRTKLSFRVGIDIGGTFTDLVLLGEAGRALTVKVPSTPDDFSRSIAESLEAALPRIGVSGAEIDEVIHGTTVATNAPPRETRCQDGPHHDCGLPRRARRSAAFACPRLYDLRWQKPEALAARIDRVEVDERIDHGGRILQPLDEGSVRAAVDKLLDNGVQAIAVALINSYANDRHETADRGESSASGAPGCRCACRATCTPRSRSTNAPARRSSTPISCPSSAPISDPSNGSCAVWRSRLHSGSCSRTAGRWGSRQADAKPVNIIESGPSAGVVGAAEIARKLGYENVLTFDMGGTTAKAAMIEGGQYDRVGELDVGAGINFAARLLKGGGYHVSVPAIDIAEVGAGGGSLVRIDAGGALCAGPESAGAMPGPVCYDQGGSVATVTDANVVLGFISPTQLVGGELAIKSGLSAQAVREQIAGPLGVSVDDAAFGIHRVANANDGARAASRLERARPRPAAVRPDGVRRQRAGPCGNPRPFARHLDHRDSPGRRCLQRIGVVVPRDGTPLRQNLQARARGHGARRRRGRLRGPGNRRLRRAGEGGLRSGHDRVRIPGGSPATAARTPTSPWNASQGLDDPRALADVFGREHERTYGYRSDEEAVELVNLRPESRAVGSAEARVPDTLSVDERGAVAGGERPAPPRGFLRAGGGPAGNPGDRPGRGW